MMHGSYGWGMGLGWPLMILFWILAIVGIVYFVRLLVGQGRSPDNEAPIDILKKRFAKGEISKEEFDRMRDELMKQ